MLYIEKYNGYLADVPNIEFVRCDGTVFAYDELNSASMTAGHNMITITGGQGNFPLAYIDTDSTLEFQFESSQFTSEIFEMANGVTMEEGDFGMLESNRFDVETGLKINIPYEVKEGSVIIRGLDEAQSDASGKFVVSITASTAATSGKTVVTFHEGDVTVGQVVRVAYQRRVVGAGKVPVKTTSTTAKGSLFAHWPIYSDGTSCADAAVKAILHLYIPRVRVTALPGFSNSYKSAATTSLTFAAMDPKLGSKSMYDLVYEPMDADGNIVTKSSVATGSVGWITSLAGAGAAAASASA
jgi:hypothetical protein